MKTRIPYCALFLGFLLLIAVSSQAHAAPERPNIIYIMVDDLGYGDLGCYGQKVVRTPHLDRLAKEGLRFTDHYSGHTVCRPSRLVLWTGKHSGNTPIDGNQPYTIKPSDVLVSELMKEAGYNVGGVGKWANGLPGTQGVPTKNGFDFWMGYLNQSNAHNFYPTYLWRCANGKEVKVELKGNVLMDHPAARGRVAHPDHRVTYSHDVMTEEALQWIRAHGTSSLKGGGKPFLFHIHWTIPHTNNEGGRVTGDGQEVPDYGIYKDKDWPNVEKGFAAMVTRMDGDVGKLVALLKELKIDKNTLILFTSDNGPHQEGGHKMEYFNSNGDLRGYKRDLYEGGIRVPMIAWWPGKVKAGTKTNHPSAFWDFLPTACELAGVKPPKNIDGISYVPTLLGKTDKQKKHDSLYWQAGQKRAVRVDNWKGVITGKNKPMELYLLATDIGEQNNVAKLHPEMVEKLQAAMDDAVE